MAILAQGDTHLVQEGTNCFVLVVSSNAESNGCFLTRGLVACCDLINQQNLLVYVCTTLVVLFLLSILTKNKIVTVRNTKYENFDVTGSRRLRDSQPQDKVWHRLETTYRFGDCNHFQERQAHREPWCWPLQGHSVRMLNFCRHRNPGPRSASSQRPPDNEIYVVVPVGLLDGGVFDFVGRFMETIQVTSS